MTLARYFGKGGYFGNPELNPRPTESLVLDAIDRALSGEPIYSDYDAGAAAEYESEQQSLRDKDREAQERDSITAAALDMEIIITEAEADHALSLVRDQGTDYEDAIEWAVISAADAIEQEAADHAKQRESGEDWDTPFWKIPFPEIGADQPIAEAPGPGGPATGPDGRDPKRAAKTRQKPRKSRKEKVKPDKGPEGGEQFSCQGVEAG